MTREEEFLIACIGQNLRSAGQCHIESEPGLNREMVVSLAETHDVLTLLPGFPNAKLEPQIRSNLLLTVELLRLLSLFEAEGILVLSLKGPVLDALLYGAAGQRSFSDLDLLVRPQDRFRAFQLLRRERYEAITKHPWQEDELTFQRVPGSIQVDVHWRLLPSSWPQPVPAARLWSGLNVLPLSGRLVPILSDEDLLLLLCTHGAKHQWERLKWICDVARLIHVRRDLDWQVVLANARVQRCRRFVLLGLALANDLFGTALPPDIVTQISADVLVRERVQMVRSRLFADQPSPSPGLDQVRFNLPLFETTLDKMRYLRAVVLTPTEAEYAIVKLPHWLHWAYYPFRFLRLNWKHEIR